MAGDAAPTAAASMTESGFLDEVRAALQLQRTITRVEIDEHQLGVLIGGWLTLTAHVGWIFASSESPPVRLDADYRRRRPDAYSTCQIVGRNVTDVEFHASGSFVVSLDNSDQLTLLKEREFENYVITISGHKSASGAHIF